MILCIPRYDGIRFLIGRHGIRYDIAQDLVPVVTTSTPSYPEGLNNEVHSPHDVRDNNYCTGESKRFWIVFRSLLIGFGYKNQKKAMLRPFRNNWLNI